MPRPPYALILLGALVVGRPALGQTPIAPQAGVLVLRNGQVIDGDVTRAGDRYIVTKGESSEIWLKADDVELFCGSLVEAYEFKVRHLLGANARQHIELAKWCLRHGLYGQVAEQLRAAADLEPDDPQIKDLQTRLTFAVESTTEGAAHASTAPVSAEELENAVRAMPKPSVEKFAAIVQPILLNRCGANNQCHGPNAKSEFRLMRPPAGQIVSRRFTQRNLYATAKYLNASDPDSSPLIVMPQQRHGNALSAVFDKQSAGQLAELVAWARLTMAPMAAPVNVPASTAPTSIAPVEATLSQPAGKTPPAFAAPGVAPTADKAASQVGTPVGVRAMRPPLGPPGGLPTGASPPPRLRDRFDPEIFNQRYHGK